MSYFSGGTTNTPDPMDMGQQATKANGSLYSDRVKITIARSERLKRNVLEVNLESEATADRIDPEATAKLLQSMGIIQPDLEGYQLSGKKKLYVWLKEGIDLTKYCRDECYRVAPGVKTALINPMDNKEVVVTIKGININTPDTLVFTYLSHFGKLVSQKVVYDTDKDGPLKGLKNGDRRYKMDFSGGRDLGTFHLIDGTSVMVSYSGQRRTCGRCHGDSRTCIGGGWAKSCELKGGTRVELRDHMRQLWSNIGFNPEKFEREEAQEDSADLNVKAFTPPVRAPVSEANKTKFSGVNFRNLPKDINLSDLQTLLEDKGLPAGHDKIAIIKYKRSTGADIEGISADICNTLIEAFNGQFITLLDRKVYCTGMTDLESPLGSPSKGPVLNLDSEALVPNKIPGLPIENKTNKPQKKPKKSARVARTMSTPGVGNNSRKGLEENDQSSSDSDTSDADSCHSKSTKSKIKLYQDLVKRDNFKRLYDEVSPQALARRQRSKDGEKSSIC